MEMNDKLKLGIILVVASLLLGGGLGGIISMFVPFAGCLFCLLTPIGLIIGIIYIIMGLMVKEDETITLDPAKPPE